MKSIITRIIIIIKIKIIKIRIKISIIKRVIIIIISKWILSIEWTNSYDNFSIYRNLSHSYTKEHNEFEQQYDTQWSGKRYEEEKYITGISTEDQKSKGRPKNSALVVKGEDKMLMLLYMTLYTVKYDNG